MVKRDGDVVEPSEPSEEESRADLREHYDILLVRAPNPGPLTLTGTNSWVVGPRAGVGGRPRAGDRRSTWSALYEAIDERGGLGGVVLTHDHQDHSEAARTLHGALSGAPLAAGARRGRRRARGRRARRAVHRGGDAGARRRPLRADRRRRLLHRRRRARRRAACSSPLPRRDVRLPARADAAAAARRLQRALPRARAARVGRARASSNEYVSHRIDRENRADHALGEGRRTVAGAARRGLAGRAGAAAPAGRGRRWRRTSTSSRKSGMLPRGGASARRSKGREW